MIADRSRIVVVMRMWQVWQWWRLSLRCNSARFSFTRCSRRSVTHERLHIEMYGWPVEKIVVVCGDFRQFQQIARRLGTRYGPWLSLEIILETFAQERRHSTATRAGRSRLTGRKFIDDRKRSLFVLARGRISM